MADKGRACVPHVGRPSVLLPESLETRMRFVHLRRRIQPVSPECLRAVVWEPERLRALRLRQRMTLRRAVRFSHQAFTPSIIQASQASDDQPNPYGLCLVTHPAAPGAHDDPYRRDRPQTR